MTAGPWYLLYVPGAIVLPFLHLLRTQTARIARLFVALLVGQGRLYTLLGLHWRCGSCDSWNMVGMGLWAGVEFLRKEVWAGQTDEIGKEELPQ